MRYRFHAQYVKHEGKTQNCHGCGDVGAEGLFRRRGNAIGRVRLLSWYPESGIRRSTGDPGRAGFSWWEALGPSEQMFVGRLSVGGRPRARAPRPLNPALDPGQCITLSVDLCVQQRLDNSPNFKYSIIL